MTISEVIRIERARLRMSQEELSNLTGIPRPIISMIETEKILPSKEYEDAILKALGCSHGATMQNPD